MLPFASLHSKHAHKKGSKKVSNRQKQLHPVSKYYPNIYLEGYSSSRFCLYQLQYCSEMPDVPNRKLWTNAPCPSQFSNHHSKPCYTTSPLSCTAQHPFFWSPHLIQFHSKTLITYFTLYLLKLSTAYHCIFTLSFCIILLALLTCGFCQIYSNLIFSNSDLNFFVQLPNISPIGHSHQPVTSSSLLKCKILSQFSWPNIPYLSCYPHISPVLQL